MAGSGCAAKAGLASKRRRGLVVDRGVEIHERRHARGVRGCQANHLRAGDRVAGEMCALGSQEIEKTQQVSNERIGVIGPGRDGRGRLAPARKAHDAEAIDELRRQVAELFVEAASRRREEYEPRAGAAPIGVVQAHAIDIGEGLRGRTCGRGLSVGAAHGQRADRDEREHWHGTSRHVVPPQSFSVNRISTVTRTATASPSRRAGSNVH